MTPKEKLVYCSTTDSVRRCREIMFQCKIRNLPVIDDDNEGFQLKGMINMKMLADSSFSVSYHNYYFTYNNV
jgi:CBS domain-containing protein